jgi:2-phosphosulfolactate phosphatase
MSGPYDQHDFEIRCEWGQAGLAALLPHCDAIVIVDVFSFSTSVDIATGNGALVYPHTRAGEPEVDLARAAALGAHLAGTDPQAGYSLFPSTLLEIPPGTRLLLPSLNGAVLSLATGAKPTFAGCLRNARVVARAAAQAAGSGAGRIGVIPAGERWPEESLARGVLRPALEDLLGAGAIAQHLPGRRSPEAWLAVAAFQQFQPDLPGCLRDCASGRELRMRGHHREIELAAALDVSDHAPRLIEGAYRSSSEAL